MSKRSYYLICYDISDAHLRTKVRELILGYAFGIQKSAFLCWLTLTERQRMVAELSELINATDKALISHLGDEFNPTYLGIQKPFDPECFIIA